MATGYDTDQAIPSCRWARQAAPGGLVNPGRGVAIFHALAEIFAALSVRETSRRAEPRVG